MLCLALTLGNLKYTSAGPDYYAWFSGIEYNLFDSDGDGYDDAVEVEMNVSDTYVGTLDVEATAILFDPDGNEVDWRDDQWTSAPWDSGYIYLYAPPGSLQGLYDVSLELWSYDPVGGGLYWEDYEYADDAVYLSPALATLVVRGMDNRIYYRRYFDRSWESWNVVPTGTTTDSPGAAVYDGKLYIAVRGMDDGLYFGWVSLTDDSFTGWTKLSGATPSSPTLATYNLQLIMVVRGMDNRIYYRFYDCNSDAWGDWSSVPTGATSDRPGAIARYGRPPPNYLPDELYIIVRGTTGGLYYGDIELDFYTFTGWTMMYGDTPSAPSLARYVGAFIPIFAVRGMNDKIYYSRPWTFPSPGSPWTELPGATCDAAGIAAETLNINFVVRGTTGGLYHGYRDSDGAFHGWTWMSGDTLSPPTLAIRECIIPE